MNLEKGNNKKSDITANCQQFKYAGYSTVSTAATADSTHRSFGGRLRPRCEKNDKETTQRKERSLKKESFIVDHSRIQELFKLPITRCYGPNDLLFKIKILIRIFCF